MSTQAFNSTGGGGEAAGHFVITQIGGFDTMVFKATDNEGQEGHDNSDFAVKSIEFSNVDAPLLSTKGDVHFLYGADGPGSVALTGVQDSTLTSEDRKRVV